MRGYGAVPVVALLLLMSGCDNDSPPATAKAPSAVDSPAATAPPPVVSERQNSAADLRALRLDPLPAKAFDLPAPPPKKKDLAKNTQLKKPASTKEVPVVQRPLDLSVPSEAAKPQTLMSRQVTPKQSEKALAEAGLLPEMFHRDDNAGRFELGGRVISRDRSDDFEGAEVELRFRR